MYDINTHLHNTWNSLIRKQRSERTEQVIPLAFMMEQNETVYYDKEAFYNHARDQGATTTHELEFLGSPVYVPGKEFIKTWQKNLGRRRFIYSLELRSIEDSGYYYYPIEQIVWTTHKNLSRRKTTPNLTTYGMNHWRNGRMNKITAWGEVKSASGWANDPRGVVSDKIIKRRVDAGWMPEDAISTLAGKKP